MTFAELGVLLLLGFGMYLAFSRLRLKIEHSLLRLLRGKRPISRRTIDVIPIRKEER